METSILKTIKRMLGIEDEDTNFDQELITYINSVLATLNQLAVGPDEGFEITGETETWDQLIDDERLNSVKTFIYMKVRAIFDPPTNSFLVSSMNDQIKELEWRLNIAAERLKSQT